MKGFSNDFYQKYAGESPTNGEKGVNDISSKYKIGTNKKKKKQVDDDLMRRMASPRKCPSVDVSEKYKIGTKNRQKRTYNISNNSIPKVEEDATSKYKIGANSSERARKADEELMKRMVNTKKTENTDVTDKYKISNNRNKRLYEVKKEKTKIEKDGASAYKIGSRKKRELKPRESAPVRKEEVEDALNKYQIGSRKKRDYQTRESAPVRKEEVEDALNKYKIRYKNEEKEKEKEKELIPERRDRFTGDKKKQNAHIERIDIPEIISPRHSGVAKMKVSTFSIEVVDPYTIEGGEDQIIEYDHKWEEEERKRKEEKQQRKAERKATKEARLIEEQEKEMKRKKEEQEEEERKRIEKKKEEEEKRIAKEEEEEALLIAKKEEAEKARREAEETRKKAEEAQKKVEEARRKAEEAQRKVKEARLKAEQEEQRKIEEFQRKVEEEKRKMKEIEEEDKKKRKEENNIRKEQKKSLGCIESNDTSSHNRDFPILPIMPPRDYNELKEEKPTYSKFQAQFERSLVEEVEGIDDVSKEIDIVDTGSGPEVAVSEDSFLILDYHFLSVGEKVGGGAFGQVCKGSYCGAEIAVKITERLEGDKLNDKYIARETSALAGCRHPNIVQFIGLILRPNQIFFVTEMVAGGNLNELLSNQEKELSWKLRTQMARDIICGLWFLHSKSIIHRDIKSRNILVTAHNRMKICDLAFARVIKDSESGRTSQNLTICGTENYMAPELLLGRPYTVSSDIFSYGVLLWEIITRKDGRSFHRTMMTRALNPSMLEDNTPKDAPKDFVNLAKRCISLEPEDRLSAEDIWHILINMETKLSVTARAHKGSGGLMKEISCFERGTLRQMIKEKSPLKMPRSEKRLSQSGQELILEKMSTLVEDVVKENTELRKKLGMEERDFFSFPKKKTTINDPRKPKKVVSPLIQANPTLKRPKKHKKSRRGL